jgi:hypothetical protein
MHSRMRPPIADIGKSRAERIREIWAICVYDVSFWVRLRRQIARTRTDFPQFSEIPDKRETGWWSAFAASDRKIVDAFHKAALAAGGGDNDCIAKSSRCSPDSVARARDNTRALYFNTGRGCFCSEHRNISLPLLDVESDFSRMCFASARPRYGDSVGSDSGSPTHRDRHHRCPGA